MSQICLPRLVRTQTLVTQNRPKTYFVWCLMVLCYFSWIVHYPEHKDKIEDGNRILIQKFQNQLTQQLDILHKTLATSVTQQEQQLKEMEEDMQSFVYTKTEVLSGKKIGREIVLAKYFTGHFIVSGFL